MDNAENVVIRQIFVSTEIKSVATEIEFVSAEFYFVSIEMISHFGKMTSA